MRPEEFDAWTQLYRGYAAFYNSPTSDEHQRQIWGWIHDDRSVEALVGVPVDETGSELGEPQGLAHLREWVRPLRGVVCGYLDDLSVSPEFRGSGAVQALFAEIDRLAQERGGRSSAGQPPTTTTPPAPSTTDSPSGRRGSRTTWQLARPRTRLPRARLRMGT